MGDQGIQSCRGHAIIVGTCDNVRERESNNELMNLLTQAIEDMVESGELPAKWRCAVPGSVQPAAGGYEDEADADADPPAAGSVAAMLAAELAQARDRDGSAGKGGASVLSVNPNIKGIVLARIMREDVCPVRLLQVVFDKVRKGGAAHSKHLIRLIPCSRVFFPTTFELVANVRNLVREKLPGAQLLPLNLPLVTMSAAAAAAQARDDDAGATAVPADGEVEVEVAAEEAEGGPAQQDRDEGEGEAQEEEAEEEEEEERGAGREGGEGEDSAVGEKRSRELVLELREKRKAAKRLKAAADAVKARTEGSHAAQRAISMESQHLAAEAVLAAAPGYVPPAQPKPFAYEVTLKARNHNTLQQTESRTWISKNMPPAPLATASYRNPDVSRDTSTNTSTRP